MCYASAAVFNWPKAVVILSSRKDVVAGFLPRRSDPTERDDDFVFWTEGQHERAFNVSAVEVDTPERFRFRNRDGDWFELLPMTLELYETHVKHRTLGKPTFETLEELFRAMANEW